MQDDIEEGRYRRNLVVFYGEYDFGEWNILISNCFTDSINKERLLKDKLDFIKQDLKEYFLIDSIFKETGEYYLKMHLRHKERREQLAKEFGRAVDIEFKISPEMKPFIGHSFLVALIRLKKKQEVNKIFIEYTQSAIFQPLTIKLKTFYPDDYHSIEPLLHYPCSMLFPNHKRYCLFIFISADRMKNSRLRFFMYWQKDAKFYEWTYFPPSIYKRYQLSLFNIKDIFEPISEIDDQKYFIDPQCTVDDENFWNNYVFKKEDGKYVYLSEVKFPKL